MDGGWQLLGAGQGRERVSRLFFLCDNARLAVARQAGFAAKTTGSQHRLGKKRPVNRILEPRFCGLTVKNG
jgi:hypothetical protein